MNLLFILQIVHVTTGTIWLGGFLFFYLVLLPYLVKGKKNKAVKLINELKKPTGIILGIAGSISITLGLIRGIYFGNLTSIDALFTPYGRNFLSAILITIFMIIFGKIYGKNLEQIIWSKKELKKYAFLKIYSLGFFFLLCYAILIYCMISMRFGGI